MKNKMLYEALYKAYNVAEGQFSGIPDCCILEFNNGRTWQTMINRTKSQKEKVEITNNWSYVPCQDCIDNKRYGQIKEGNSPIGEMLLYLMEKVVKQDEENIGNR